MKLLVLIFAFVSGLSWCTSAHAQTLNFDFTLTGGSATSNIGGGTVTGEIMGLQNNASSTPSDILIFSAPAGLGISSSLPYSLEAHGWNLSGDAEGASITVSNGAITSSTDYEASIVSQDDYLSLNVPLIVNGVEEGPLNGLEIDTKYVSNTEGFAGVTYTLATPEPASWALGLVAVVFVVALRRKTRL